MKYLVVSDNHGDRDILVQLVDRYKGKVDHMFHCGDSELPSSDELWKNFTVVTGNCDFDPGFKTEQIVKIGSDTIFMTHGHQSNVRFGLTTLALQAAEKQADIALFGHIHQAVAEMDKGILFVNPGSISQPRGPIQIPSYAIITSESTYYEVDYFNRAHKPVEELSVHLSK
ncbi:MULTISPECIES: metallophosphoesterase [Enterococcus]|uniref:Phosphoesterase n=1 Tax=Enterococcus alishanensis TaxID=1303817 RepID=A0ABS6TB61_9ENTE|nr:metallophosphoesterase [Enterococcus alishanensis]MBV7390143.1 metallophosphoesterase [Enterococcus alishanensis]